jgi:hypothetical protein
MTAKEIQDSVLRHLDAEPITPSELIARTLLSACDVRAALLRLILTDQVKLDLTLHVSKGRGGWKPFSGSEDTAKHS